MSSDQLSDNVALSIEANAEYRRLSEVRKAEIVPVLVKIPQLLKYEKLFYLGSTGKRKYYAGRSPKRNIGFLCRTEGEKFRIMELWVK